MIKALEVDNVYFRPYVKLFEQTDFKTPDLLIEVNPPVSLIGNHTSIIVVLADLNLENPKEQQYRIVVSVIEANYQTTTGINMN